MEIKIRKKYLYLYNRYVHIYLQAMHIAQTKRIMKKSAFVDFFPLVTFFWDYYSFCVTVKRELNKSMGLSNYCSN